MVKEQSPNSEASLFESSEMLATFLASTPLLEEAWKLCSHANTSNPQSFAVNQVEDVAYFAFSGVQAVAGVNPSSSRDMVALETAAAAKGVFSNFRISDDGGGKDPVMVHQGFLNLFLSFYNNPRFQEEMVKVMKRSKSIVFTGQSVGGTIASLASLWLLVNLQTSPSHLSVLCITFGSPMLGNKSFAKAILEERLAGNFCHVVVNDDIVPALLFAPLAPFHTELHYLFQSWNLSMMSPYFSQLAPQISDERKNELFQTVLASLEALSGEIDDREGKQFWPFGSYMFCSSKGAICLDNSLAVLKLLRVMLAKGSPGCSFDGHLKYKEYIGSALLQLLRRRCSSEGAFLESNYDAGVRLALESSEMNHQESVFQTAKGCLQLAKQQGRRRNLNSAKLTAELYNTKKHRVQIEWYKDFCDESIDQMGYYDSFKRRGASKRETKVNMNRLKLASFWNNVLGMLERNQVPHDFHKQLRWVNAAQFYKLLVEPLEIAEYYRTEKDKEKGHYLQHGRPKRYKIFDKWWKDRNFEDEKTIVRTSLASLTQDSCFWARVEEARDCLTRLRSENDSIQQAVLLGSIKKFEEYARGMIERKEVSKDVLARYSSYTLFQKEWQELAAELHWLHPQVPSFMYSSFE